ncbi:MAG: Uncharacterized protein Greene07147_149 [Parcubacteria group bacterium Greene0714_7]|nr:MAG: Uncharacterized protein Greene07147_149 [Parcubacteria group bacterium Greene0714_7]
MKPKSVKKAVVFKKDAFLRARGGYSRLLELSCEHCKGVLCLYQKDGPGILKRLYTDRMIPEPTRTAKQLVCEHCERVLGALITYKKEDRPAYRLFVGAVAKKIVKSQ